MNDPAAGVQVRALEDAGEGAWNAFVDACPQASFFHRAEWRRVITRAFGHRTHYLYAAGADGAIRAVLPLAEVRSRLFGHALVSTPFCVYGGAAGESGAVEALEARAAALAEALGVGALELRNVERCRPDWPAKSLYVTFRRPIAADVDANLKAIPRKQRAMVRKGIDAGLQSAFDEDLDRFFRVYATSVRNLGTPVFPRRYFAVLRELFGDRCRILTVTQAGTAVASVMSFYYRDTVLPYYGGGTEQARRCKAHDFMYWELMRRACEDGIRVFDYGRSKVGTGSYDFKKNWGFEPQPLHYQYHLVRAAQVPEVNPLNPRYRLFIRLWQRLPLPLANALGPLLSRSLG